MPPDLLELARKRGTDKEFLGWLRTQPSAIDEDMDYDPDTGLQWCDPCHYRTAKNSGTGCKPKYSAIPLTHKQHLEQHRIGQFNFLPREEWERLTRFYLVLWINSA